MSGPARENIDPTFKALLDSLPMIFDLTDGVEAVRARLKQLQVPAETLPALRIEDRTVGHGEYTDARSSAPACGEAKRKLASGCSGAGAARGGQRRRLASAGDSPDRDATDT